MREEEGEREREKRNEEEKNFIRKFDKGSPRIFCETGEILRSYLIARQTSTPESWLPYNVATYLYYICVVHVSMDRLLSSIPPPLPLCLFPHTYVREYQGGYVCTCVSILYLAKYRMDVAFLIPSLLFRHEHETFRYRLLSNRRFLFALDGSILI